MIIKEVDQKYFGWDPTAYRGKGYWFELTASGQMGRAASKKEASTLGHPKEYSTKYTEAQKTIKSTFSESVIDKLLTGKGLFPSVGSTVSEKIKARLTNIKRAFDPLNVIHKIFGGGSLSNVMTTWIGKKFGRSEKDIQFFTKRNKIPNQEYSTNELKITGSISTNIKKIYKLLSKKFEKDNKEYIQKRNQEENYEEVLELRNQKLIKALMGKEIIPKKKIKINLKAESEIGKDIMIGAGLVAIGKAAEDEIDSLIPKIKIKNLKDVEVLIEKIEKFLTEGAAKEEPKAVAPPTPKEMPSSQPRPAPSASPEVPSSSVPLEKEPTTAKPAENISKKESFTPAEPKKTGSLKPMEQEKPIAELSGPDLKIADLIKKHEGLRLTPYKDTRGFWTVGYGHYIGKTLPPSMNRTFTQDEVDKLFATDYLKHKLAAEQIPNFNLLNEDGKAAMIDMTFNMGPNWWKSWPRFTAAMQKGDINSAIQSLKNSAWFKQVGNRSLEDVALLKTNENVDGLTLLAKASESSSGTTIIQNNTIVAQNTTENNSMIKSTDDSSSLVNKAKA